MRYILTETSSERKSYEDVAVMGVFLTKEAAEEMAKMKFPEAKFEPCSQAYFANSWLSGNRWAAGKYVGGLDGTGPIYIFIIHEVHYI